MGNDQIVLERRFELLFVHLRQSELILEGVGVFLTIGNWDNWLELKMAIRSCLYGNAHSFINHSYFNWENMGR